MNQHNTQANFSSYLRALRNAFQWRLLLLWIVTLALPTLIVALPLRKVLGGLMDHSVHSLAWAQHFNALAMSDIMMLLPRAGTGLPGDFSVAMILTLLFSPFLTGMVVVAARSSERLSLGQLVHAGITEYWRLFRMLLWAIAPFAVAFGIGVAAMGIAKKHAEAAVLQSSADAGTHFAMIIMIVVLVLAHVMVESGRAQFAADGSLRSATLAFGRGIMMLLRRPLATLGMYLGVSIVGYLVAFILGLIRIRMTAAGGFGFFMAEIVTQLIVITLAWQRTARLFALADVVHSTPARPQPQASSTVAASS